MAVSVDPCPRVTMRSGSSSMVAVPSADSIVTVSQSPSAVSFGAVSVLPQADKIRAALTARAICRDRGRGRTRVMVGGVMVLLLRVERQLDRVLGWVS